MIIMNFSSTTRRAFLNGFMKGFTAPSVLFGRHEIPNLHEVRTVLVKRVDDAMPLECFFRFL